MTVDTSSIRSISVAAPQFRLARAMYAANILFAGIPGLIITFAPRFAETQMFVGSQERVTFSMLGAIWLSIGIISSLGLRNPRRYVGVFAVQVVYKTIWIAMTALPLRTSRSDVIPFALGFALVAVGFAGAFVTAISEVES